MDEQEMKTQEEQHADRVLHYEFGIGDTVKLKGKESENNVVWDHVDFDSIKNVVFKVSGWGWTETEDGFSKFYRIGVCDGNCGYRYLRNNNEIDEYNLVPAGETHPFEENTKTKSFDGSTIRIGMKVYSNLYRNACSDPYVNTSFVFSGYGEVYKIKKYNGESDNYHNVYTTREFLCKREDGKDWLDARKFGSKSYESPMYIVVNVPENFAQKYVEEYIKRKDKHLETDNYKNFDVTEYLKHTGVYDEVVGLLNEQTEQAEDKPNSDRNLLSLVEGLTEEEKKRLKELL